MKYNIFIAVVATLLLSACEIMVVDCDVLQYRSGVYYKVNADRGFSGTCKGASMIVAIQGEFKRRYKDGKLHGTTIYYHGFTGKVWQKKQYKHGKLHGEWIKYFYSGQVEFKGTYKDGKKHGEFVSYYENGEIELKEIYREGELVE